MTTPPDGAQLSDDGIWWWDGAAWQPVAQPEYASQEAAPAQDYYQAGDYYQVGNDSGGQTATPGDQWVGDSPTTAETGETTPDGGSTPDEPPADEASAEWEYLVIAMADGHFVFGASAALLKFTNLTTGRNYRGWLGGGGLGIGWPPGGISVSVPSSGTLRLDAPATSADLGGAGTLTFVEAGLGVGRFEGVLDMHSGAMAGQRLDLGGWQGMSPGFGGGSDEVILYVEED